MKTVIALCASLTLSTATMAADWEIQTRTSPMDDSPIVKAQLMSDDGTMALVGRCKEAKTELFVIKIQFTHCSNNGIRAIYRLDQNKAVDARWNPASNCRGAFVPAPIEFLRSLPDNGRMYVRLFDYTGEAHEATFNLGNVSKIRDQIAATCRWANTAKAK